MPIRPTPWTAAAAGAVALPAHVLVLGFAPPGGGEGLPRAAPGSLDKPLLARIAAWTVAALATTLLAGATGLTAAPPV